MRITIVLFLLLSSGALATAKYARWSGWELKIGDNICGLSNSFKNNDPADRTPHHFLSNTPFYYFSVSFVSVTKKSSDPNISSIAPSENIVRVTLFAASERSSDEEVSDLSLKGIPIIPLQSSPRTDTFQATGLPADILLDAFMEGSDVPLEIQLVGGARASTKIPNRAKSRFLIWNEAFETCKRTNQ